MYPRLFHYHVAGSLKEDSDALHFGAMMRHAEIEPSALAKKMPILHDCAAGIAGGNDRTGQAKLFGDAVLPHFKR